MDAEQEQNADPTSGLPTTLRVPEGKIPGHSHSSILPDCEVAQDTSHETLEPGHKQQPLILPEDAVGTTPRIAHKRHCVYLKEAIRSLLAKNVERHPETAETVPSDRETIINVYNKLIKKYKPLARRFYDRAKNSSPNLTPTASPNRELHGKLQLPLLERPHFKQALSPQLAQRKPLWLGGVSPQPKMSPVGQLTPTKSRMFSLYEKIVKQAHLPPLDASNLRRDEHGLPKLELPTLIETPYARPWDFNLGFAVCPHTPNEESIPV